MSGTYTDIVRIVAPSEAVAGETVSIEVKIKNTYSSTIRIMVGGALEYGPVPWPTIDYPQEYTYVGPGDTHTFTGYFTMPDSDVTVHAYSYYYGTDGLWHWDDEETKDISVAELVAEFSQFEITDYSKV